MIYISFALVGLKKILRDENEYTLSAMKKLKEQKIISNFAPIIKKGINDETRKEYSFNCSHDQYCFDISFLFEEYGEIKYLYIRIKDDTFLDEQNEEYEMCIDKVKFSLKKVLRRDWVRLFWFRDTISAELSKELYPLVYDIENLLRQLIYEVIIKEFGLQWWEKYITYNIDDKYKSRYMKFKEIVEDFKDIDDKLLSIDVDDLKKILYYKIYRWEPVYDLEIERIVCSQSKSNNLDGLLDKLKKQLVLEHDLWNEYFSRCIQCENDFKLMLENFIMHRNHVAHNKVLDRNSFVRIKHGSEKLRVSLNKAIDNIPQIILSKDEVKSRQEIQEYIEQEDMKEDYKRLVESESGVSCFDSIEIKKRFDDVLRSIFDRIEIELDYRNDLEYSKYKSILDKDSEENPIFTVMHKVTEEIIEVYCTLNIDEVPSDISNAQLSFRKGESEDAYKIELIYINGEAQFDEEAGTYMPVTSNEMQWPDDVVDEGASYIDEELKNLRKEVDGSRYYREKNGEISPCADFPCEVCREGYVCIDENLAPIGICLNCGSKNDVAICNRCESYFEGTEKDFLCPWCKEKNERE